MKKEKQYRKILSQVSEAYPEQGTEWFTDSQLEHIRTMAGAALGILAIGGVLTISAVAPNLFVALHRLIKQRGSGTRVSAKEKQFRVAKVLHYLKREGYVTMVPDGNDIKLFLTGLGKKKVEDLHIKTLQIAKPKTWDKKWWQVAADIPTKGYRRGADLLRRKLRSMGFYPLQRTLWFYPFKPIKELNFITQSYGIGEFVTVMEVSRMDRQDERLLRKHFKAAGLL